MNDKLLFEVDTPFGWNVHASVARWQLITSIKHRVMRERETDVLDTLHSPDEVRISRSDPSVFMFYKLERLGRWICAVVKKLNNHGFLITAYPTDAIKQGEQVWSK